MVIFLGLLFPLGLCFFPDLDLTGSSTGGVGSSLNCEPSYEIFLTQSRSPIQLSTRAVRAWLYLDLVMMVQPISFLNKACHQQESKTQCNPPDFQGNCGRLCPLHVRSWHPPERGEARLHLLQRLLIASRDHCQRQAWSKSVLHNSNMSRAPQIASKS